MDDTLAATKTSSSAFPKYLPPNERASMLGIEYPTPFEERDWTELKR